MDWKTIAIDTPDPVAFAKELQSTLQELTDDGFQLTSQMHRGEALIITANRVHNIGDTLPAPPVRRRVVLPSTPSAQGLPSDEVLYHYLEKGLQKQLICGSMVDALRAVKEHLKNDDVLPLNITSVTMTRFEPDVFPTLFKMFVEEL